MHFLKLPLRNASLNAYYYGSMLCPNNFSSKNVTCSIHMGAVQYKFITQTELVHKGVMYGRSAYPTRPNDPRVPSNPQFSMTHLKKRPVLTSEPSQSKILSDDSAKLLKKNNISKAMKIYLENAKRHNQFIAEHEEEFEMGRRHLANMMGLNETTMTQSDIDHAIRYLMPSGLFDPRARPRMRPPNEIYPAIKEAQFRPNGRPFHSFFYTGRANFYQACFDIEEQLNRLKEYEDSQIRSGILNPPKESKVVFKSDIWLPYMDMKQLFLEKLNEKKYEAFIFALERLASHPYSIICKEFLLKFRKEIKSASEMVEIAQLKYDEDGRPYMNAVGQRKHCVAYVTVRGNGTGQVDINGEDILYFEHWQDREQVMTPLKFCGLLFKVDIECKTMHEEFTKEWSEDAPPFVNGNIRELGTSSQSGAIRYALSLALKSFVDAETVEKMRLAGLLTKDFRFKERKKWGQEGARRKFTWKKR